MKKIKIIADDKIPFLKGVLEPVGDITFATPKNINNSLVKNADALIIRTRTKCNKELLDETNVKFIATATIGFDHIDTEYCRQNKIKWINAPGCNSSSVMQYMASALLSVAVNDNIDLKDKTIGIVGVGNVGSKIAKLANTLGMNIILNDPPRERKEGSKNFSSLEYLVKHSDIITFHVPLNKEGSDKTYHLADKDFFDSVKNNAIIINTSRGAVVNNKSLKEALLKKKIKSAILDVWENEPEIDLELLDLVKFGTPHIAGYSADGKANGTAVCVNSINEYFNLGLEENWYPEIPVPSNNQELVIDCPAKSIQEILHEAVLHTYNISEDDKLLRNSPGTFEDQRGNYRIRREFPFYKIELKNSFPEIKNLLQKLGFQIT